MRSLVTPCAKYPVAIESWLRRKGLQTFRLTRLLAPSAPMTNGVVMRDPFDARTSKPPPHAMDIRHTHRQQIGARALGCCQKRAVEFCAARDHQRRRVRRQGDVCVSALVRLDESGGANSHGGQSTRRKRLADERERAPRDSSTTRFFAWMGGIDQQHARAASG